jgi:hypothetical protein
VYSGLITALLYCIANCVGYMTVGRKIEKIKLESELKLQQQSGKTKKLKR